MNFINAAQLHLAVNHISVILSITGFIMLLIAMLRSQDSLAKTSFYIFLFAGILCLPAFFSGEGAEEIAENLPGVSKNHIDPHEDFAKIALITSLITAALALAGIVFYEKAGKLIRSLVMIASIVSCSSLAWTAHLGGQIRHTELRKDFTTGAGNTETGAGKEEHEEHD